MEFASDVDSAGFMRTDFYGSEYPVCCALGSQLDKETLECYECNESCTGSCTGPNEDDCIVWFTDCTDI